MAVINNPIVEIAYKLKADYKKNFSINDFLITIGTYYSEKEIIELLQNGVECGYDKYLTKEAIKDAEKLCMHLLNDNK